MKKIKFKKAFTLVEILLAVFILEIGLLGIATFYSKSFQVARTARLQTMATNLAAGVLEEQLSISYANLINISKRHYSNDQNDPLYNWWKQVDVYFVDANLNNSQSNTHMKKIVVTIYWTDEGTEKSFQEITLKAEH